VLSRESTNTNFIVLGLTRSGIEPTTYRTQGEHAKQYATDVVIKSVLARGFEPRLGQTKDYKIGICCFLAKHEGDRAKTGWFDTNMFNCI
jgi:hypothetical protein